MRNYGEELAYWYFRLNGFFPIVDWVDHRDVGRGTTDADIIAVRPKYSDEHIGGAGDLDELFEGRKTFNLGVICQVKTGVPATWEFDDGHVGRAIKRLGMMEVPESLSLRGKPEVSDESTTILKILIAPENWRRETRSHHFVSMEQVNDFLIRRMRHYPAKDSDRHFFPSTLLQYIIHFNRPHD
ncbi:MAG: hypothetical protein KA175_03130 [Flavobacteriales bacterium]|nr:hypothetical protein [Flavobacteriales bacterium]